MANARHGIRVQCEERCVLNLFVGTYECRLDNISISGAYVCCDGRLPSLGVGDDCSLFLCHDPKVCPKDRPCRIARVSNQGVGLRFVQTQ